MAIGTKMAALLSVHHLPVFLSIHGEQPSMTELAYHNSDIYHSAQHDARRGGPLKYTGSVLLTTMGTKEIYYCRNS